MKRRLEMYGYLLTLRGRFGFWWSRLFFRWYCPYPVIDDWTACACVRGGHCGCDNQRRYRT